MKKLLLSFLILFCVTLFSEESNTKSQFPPAVTPVKNYTPPQLSTPDSWTMVVVPDTQAYVKNLRNQGTGDMIFSWIAENVDKLKIQQVIHLGDLVDDNINFSTSDKNNQTSPKQWKCVSRYFERLDNIVPYIITTGNHDVGHGRYYSAEDYDSELAKYFHFGRNSKWENTLWEVGLNGVGKRTLENAAYRFTTPNGQKILIVAVGFAPTQNQMKWVQEVFEHPEHKDYFGILVTHSYSESQLGKNPRIAIEHYPICKAGGNSGEAIFYNYVRRLPNLRMVLCGHISSPDNWLGCVNYTKSKNWAGKTVHEILFDPQALGGGWHGNGGDGWIRLMEFDKDMKTVKVKTFSPFFAYSPSTQHLAWHTAPFNEFEFDID